MEKLVRVLYAPVHKKFLPFGKDGNSRPQTKPRLNHQPRLCSELLHCRMDKKIKPRQLAGLTY